MFRGIIIDADGRRIRNDASAYYDSITIHWIVFQLVLQWVLARGRAAFQ